MSKDSPLDYFAEAPPTGRRGLTTLDAFWALTPVAALLISGFIWIYQITEPFYGGGSFADRFVYRLLTPLILVCWPAWAVWTVCRVVRRRLRARWLALLPLPLVAVYLVLTSLYVYCADQGIRIGWIDRVERLIDRALHW